MNGANPGYSGDWRPGHYVQLSCLGILRILFVFIFLKVIPDMGKVLDDLRTLS